MSFHAVLYQLGLVVAALLCVGVAAYAWRHREQRGGKLLVGLLAAVVFWIAMSATIAQFKGQPLAIAAGKTQYVGVVGSVLTFFLLSLEYTGRENYITRRTVAVLLVMPVLTVVAAWVPPLQQLFATYGARDPSTFFGYAVTPGPLFYVHTFYSYILLATGAALFLNFAVRSEHLYRQQVGAILVAMAAPWVGNALYLFTPISVDLTPLAFAVTGLALWWAIFSRDFLTILPVARTTVVDNISAGVFVLDRRNHVVDINDTGREMLDLGEADVIGRDARELLAAYPDVRERFTAVADTEAEIDTEVQFGESHYRVQISPLYDRRDTLIGRLFLVNDITEQKHRQQELERQNDQLEQFANVVSHDLRNPINVAAGNLELGRMKGYDEPFETVDQEYLAAVDDALDRMDRIVDDVLTLAREGRGIDERESVTLSAVAEAAWETVDTGAATLDVGDDADFVADADRLQRALENLFRNAVEHGGADVTVTVEATADGFAVADDGPGIPEADRDDVFTDGFTTNEDGTGFGLSIVQSIVEAHGWTVAVEESETGGAAFVVRDVATISERREPREQRADDD